MTDSLPEVVDLRVVLGSTTPPGRLHRALGGAIDRVSERAVTADLLDLGTLDIAFAGKSDPADLDDDTGTAIAAVAAAGALIFATPVYRGSMTGALKNLFDLIPVPALRGKVIGLVAMGASDHHFLGAERHLRDVLVSFAAFTMPVAVYLNGADFNDGEPGERAATALDELLLTTVDVSTAIADIVVAGWPAPLAPRALHSGTTAAS